MPFDFAAQIDKWRSLLLDTTKRNRLINFKTGRGGGISLVYPEPADFWHNLVTANAMLSFVWLRDLLNLPNQTGERTEETPSVPESRISLEILERSLDSPRLRPDHLLTDLPDKVLATRLTRLHLAARESMTEQGVSILYVAFGFLRWFESADSDVEIRSPLLLVPVQLQRESIEAAWQLQLVEEEVHPNHSLARLLADDFHLQLPEFDETADTSEAAFRKEYFGAVERAVRAFPRWEVLDEAALGAFSFQKLAAWQDLDRNRERIMAHDLCRAIAGDHSVALRRPADVPRAEELDQKVRLGETYSILDADSSQQAAIAAAVRGASLVLDGPPGTGKSQTISNVIAEFLAAGKTVLFVSEKAAALEVVKKRLDKQGLGDFCLECHGQKVNKREVVAELGRCLALAPESGRFSEEEQRQLLDLRTRLNDYAQELRLERPPLNRTAYQVHGELARLARLGSISRCPVPRVLERDAAFLDRVTELLSRLSDCRGAIEEPAKHPWRECLTSTYRLTLIDDVRHHFGRLAERLGRFEETACVLREFSIGPANPTRTEWFLALEKARQVVACPLVPASWFARDVRATAEAVVHLDRATRTYRQIRDCLSEFNQSALGSLDPSFGAKWKSAWEGAGSGLRPRAKETLRGLAQRLSRVGDSLHEIKRLAEAADEAERRIAGLLQTPLRAVKVKELAGFARLTESVAGLGSVRRSWWDAARRKELQTALSRCQGEEATAQALRAELTARLSPQAFALESAATAAQAARFRWFLARWRTFKKQVSGWYVQGLPKTTPLLDDMAKLAAYHRGSDYCRQIQQLYADDLRLDAEGKPDWSGILKALDVLDALEGLTKMPALRERLSSNGQLDRAALGAAGAELARVASSLRKSLEALATDDDLSEITDGSPHHVRVGARGLVTWVGKRTDIVNRALESLNGFLALLAAGQDPVAAEGFDKATAIGQLASLQEEIRHRREFLRHSDRTCLVEDSDLSKASLQAAGLLRFLKEWGQPLEPSQVQALTNAAGKDRLAEAVRRADAVRADGFDESWKFLTSLFDPAASVSTGIVFDRANLSDLRLWLANRTEDAPRLLEWVRYCETRRELEQAGVGTILDEVVSGQVKMEESATAFRARFLRLWLDAVYERAVALRQFGTEKHEDLIQRFQKLDRRFIEKTPTRVRHLLLNHPNRPSVLTVEAAPASSELGILSRQVQMKRRHLPLRKLFAAIPTLLPRLKPCLMMSPLAVSTYLQSPDCQFDLVIFDEASQVRPHDAIAAIYRGRQWLVAGDQKQLPPTSFFERSLDEEDEASEDETDLRDYDSVLDVCCGLRLLRRRLRWHYRSRREELIAFANHHVYEGELVTFPSPQDVTGNPAVRFEFVSEGRWKTGAGFNAVEARRTAELVLEHFRNHPDRSLGVIAFGQKHQMRIMDELERLRRANPECEGFFREDREEAFFVKNLENVQGDERDVIFLAVGYGPNEQNQKSMNFGPLNKSHGARRLNVAVTRAKQGMLVISSLHAHDLDLSRTEAKGVHLLRAFLDYAERGPIALPASLTEVGTHGYDSPFEKEVAEELERRGLSVHSQVGCSGYRIDLALADPASPGRYLLGVECDGATYHASATARDRDRLRQEVNVQGFAESGNSADGARLCVNRGGARRGVATNLVGVTSLFWRNRSGRSDQGNGTPPRIQANGSEHQGLFGEYLGESDSPWRSRANERR